MLLPWNIPPDSKISQLRDSLSHRWVFAISHNVLKNKFSRSPQRITADHSKLKIIFRCSTLGLKKFLGIVWILTTRKFFTKHFQSCTLFQELILTVHFGQQLSLHNRKYCYSCSVVSLFESKVYLTACFPLCLKAELKYFLHSLSKTWRIEKDDSLFGYLPVKRRPHFQFFLIWKDFELPVVFTCLWLLSSKHRIKNFRAVPRSHTLHRSCKTLSRHSDISNGNESLPFLFCLHGKLHAFPWWCYRTRKTTKTKKTNEKQRSCYE